MKTLMKSVVLIILLFVGVVAQAQPNRVLTSAEKEILQTNARFQSECNWSVKNFASYWSTTVNVTIASQITSVGYPTWFRNHIFSTNVMTSGFNDPSASQTFTVLAKGMNLWDNAVTPFNPDTVIDYMIANNKFEELATPYVVLKTQSIIF